MAPNRENEVRRLEARHGRCGRTPLRVLLSERYTHMLRLRALVDEKRVVAGCEDVRVPLARAGKTFRV